MTTVKNRSVEDLKKWYLSAVRGDLVINYGFMEEEADKIIVAYRLKDRLEKATDAQLHMDIEDTTREMKREGYFAYAN